MGVRKVRVWIRNSGRSCNAVYTFIVRCLCMRSDPGKHLFLLRRYCQQRHYTQMVFVWQSLGQKVRLCWFARMKFWRSMRHCERIGGLKVLHPMETIPILELPASCLILNPKIGRAITACIFGLDPVFVEHGYFIWMFLLWTRDRFLYRIPISEKVLQYSTWRMISGMSASGSLTLCPGMRSVSYASMFSAADMTSVLLKNWNMISGIFLLRRSHIRSMSTAGSIRSPVSTCLPWDTGRVVQKPL